MSWGYHHFPEIWLTPTISVHPGALAEFQSRDLAAVVRAYASLEVETCFFPRPKTWGENGADPAITMSPQKEPRITLPKTN